MSIEERIEFEQKYLEILKVKINDGLETLKQTAITDNNYKDLVVNINNSNNILLQLQNDINELSTPTDATKTE